MRMLENEFGSGALGKNDGKMKMIGDHVVGSVNADGKLITDGPKARTAVRVMQCLLALIAAGSGIYGALAIHPPKPAPPASKGPAYILYAFSVISFLFSVYFFGIRPCVQRGRRRKRGKFTAGQMGGSGMMVLPVIQGLGQKGKGGTKKGKKGKGQRGGEDGVQVNLIVDPNMFGGGSGRNGGNSGKGRRSRRRRDEEDGGESDEESSLSDDPWSSPSKRRKNPQRRNVFEAIAMEEDWKAARKSLKWQFAVDVLFMVLWGAVFFYVLWGKRCPPGQYDGWCTTYNISTACACLCALAFGFGIFYDIKDMSASKISPRTRP